MIGIQCKGLLAAKLSVEMSSRLHVAKADLIEPADGTCPGHSQIELRSSWTARRSRRLIGEIPTALDPASPYSRNQ